jgi:transposase-like protein
LLRALGEMVIHGVSTRNIAAITEELCGEEFSQSTVSEWCKRLDPIVHGGNERSLKEKRDPFVLVDALVRSPGPWASCRLVRAGKRLVADSLPDVENPPAL